MKASLAIAVLALTLPQAGIAQEAGAGATKQEKQICRTQPVTGSRTRVRQTCHTEREWNMIAANARKSISDLSQQAGVTNGALDTVAGRANAAIAGQ